MTTKKQGLYQEVLDLVINCVRDKVGHAPQPNLIMSDFELAILGATVSRFPNSRVRGCWFHFAQVPLKQNRPFLINI